MGRHRGGLYDRPTYKQAERILAKFGGVKALCDILEKPYRNRATIYRWQMARPYGTGGLIPPRYREQIEQAARVHGILLLPEDWDWDKHDWTEDGAPEVFHALEYRADKGPSLADILS